MALARFGTTTTPGFNDQHGDGVAVRALIEPRVDEAELHRGSGIVLPTRQFGTAVRCSGGSPPGSREEYSGGVRERKPESGEGVWAWVG